MDLKAVGQRIKAAREAKNLTQEELAALVSLSPTHVSVIERGLKVTKLDTFIAIANALDVSADTRITFTGLFLGQSIRLPQITLFLLLHVPPFHARICGAYKYGSMHAYGVYVLLLLSVRV